MTETLDADRLEIYKLAAKKCKELGYPLTRDRIWDQFISISMRSGIRGILASHRSQLYFAELQRLGLMPMPEQPAQQDKCHENIPGVAEGSMAEHLLLSVDPDSEMGGW